MADLVLNSDTEKRLRSLSLPVANASPLIVPNSTVAEIMPYTPPEPLEGEEWLLGLYHWRGYTLPLIALEPLLVINWRASQTVKHERIAVMNRLRRDSNRPFYAIVLDGVPHLLNIGSTTLTATGEIQADHPLLLRVSYLGIPYAIPNLEYCEALADQVTISEAIA